MKVQVSESGTWRRTVEVEVPPETVEERIEKAYRSYGKSLNLPGFRKGKVPVNVVKAQFGNAIQGEVLQELVQEFYREASRSEGLHPVSEATIEEVDHEEGQPLRFKASVDVKPELEVEGYKELKATRPVYRIEDSHVEEHLRVLQNQNAAEQAVDRPAELSDMLLADIQELDPSGVPIIGRKQEDQTLHLGGPDSPNHDLENQLVGIVAGEDRRVLLTRPESEDTVDRPEPDLRLLVSAKEVRERVLPELDDEFAKDLGDFDSIDALKARIREEFQGRADFASRRRLQESITDALIRNNDIELPESMVETYLDSVVESYEKEHGDHGHEIDKEAVRKESREGAIRSLKHHLLVEAIAKREAIQVGKEDIDDHVRSLSTSHKMEYEQLRQAFERSGRMDRVESELLEEKIFDFLIEHAEIEDVEEVSDRE